MKNIQMEKFMKAIMEILFPKEMKDTNILLRFMSILAKVNVVLKICFV